MKKTLRTMSEVQLNALMELFGNATFEEVGDCQSWQHTHWRVWVGKPGDKMIVREVCKNEYGSTYGLGTEARIDAPDWLIQDDDWTDIAVWHETELV